MPHLSPINWVLAYIFFWILLTIVMSGFWWSQAPQFKIFRASNGPVSKVSPVKSSAMWNWS